MSVNKKIMLYGSIFFFPKVKYFKRCSEEILQKKKNIYIYIYFIFNKATACGYGKKMFHCKFGNVVVSSFV